MITLSGAHTLGRTCLHEGSTRRRAEPSTLQYKTFTRDIHAHDGIRTGNPKQVSGRRATPQTERPPGSAFMYFTDFLAIRPASVSCTDLWFSACCRCQCTVRSWMHLKVAYCTFKTLAVLSRGWDLTLIQLTWRILWAPNNASKWQMGFNSAFKGLTPYVNEALISSLLLCLKVTAMYLMIETFLD